MLTAQLKSELGCRGRRGRAEPFEARVNQAEEMNAGLGPVRWADAQVDGNSSRLN